MPTVNSVPQFLYGLENNFKSIEEKNANNFYFLTDTQRLFIGDVEYTRPIQHGTTLPITMLPPNSLFYHETEKALYYSKDGSAWVACSNFYEHPSFTAAVVGANTSGTVDFGGSFKIPSLTVNEEGHVTAAEDITITLPDVPEQIPNTLTTDGEGNAVTAVTLDKDGHTFTVTKGENFATSAELTALDEKVDTKIDIAGGAFTGPVTVVAPTEDTHAVNKGYVTEAISTAVGKITSFELDTNDGHGYDSLEALKTAHPTGVKGTLYLVKSTKTSPDNAYEEYFWTGEAYERAGTFGDIDLSSLATKEELATKVDKTITVNGQALSGNVVIEDIDGNAATATKLATPVKINGKNFDGSADITITAEANAHTHTIADITDIAITEATSGQVLKNNGTKWVNATLTKSDVGLNNVDNTSDAEKNVATAETLATARKIAIEGDATGEVSFDGSKDVSINLSVANAINAVNASKATSDANGNNISTTYATKEELKTASITWGTF